MSLPFLLLLLPWLTAAVKPRCVALDRDRAMLLLALALP